MGNKHDFYDRAFIRLKRQYGKDEVVATLIKKLSEAETEIGKLSAEIDHLQNELQNDKEQKEINRLAKVEVRKNELYCIKVEDNRAQREEIKNLRRMRNDLIGKISKLEKKCTAN